MAETTQGYDETREMGGAEMIEYTEGPWEIVEQNEKSMFSPFADNPFCIVAGEHLLAIGKQQGKKTMANARLIKGAPKLLEALLVVQEYAHNNRWTDEDFHDPEHGGWITMIDDAVREARGF